MDILIRYTPYKFIQERDEAGKLTGVKTVFHKSFLRAKAEEARKQEERRGA
jgi:hypothetical protein